MHLFYFKDKSDFAMESIENMTRYVPLTIMLVLELVQTSAIFELIGTMSEKLKDAVYGVPWEHMDIKTRRTVTIFLINVQEPIYVQALGLAQIGLAQMAAVSFNMTPNR
ncbi:unnamed protein product [Arctia plantaginis]|uniref:Uncharacterized protein n=1 Tax=Arctia plantaginis TaxID=874455 RepID=A0A8S0Z0I8_ARCPL|nr:unnamed protein product [Arctia plantaginis]